MAILEKSGPPPDDAPVPARPVTTALEWDDLVLDEAARNQVDDIVAWARHEPTLMEDWRLGGRIKPGFRSLFYGPPGTGKALAATLIGKTLGRPVYRVDLTKAGLSPFAETRNEFENLFDQARLRDWILFFDEADAVFGKRTPAQNANDRYANQQTAYLLQRIEDHPGVVIAASNLRSLVDDAFARRFQSLIHFALPDQEQRLRLWRDCLKHTPVAANVDLPRVAKDHALAGGAIVEAVRHACLKAVQRDPPEIQHDDIAEGARRQLRNGGEGDG